MYAAPVALAMHPQRDQILRNLICRAARSEQIPADLAQIDGAANFADFSLRWQWNQTRSTGHPIPLP